MLLSDISTDTRYPDQQKCGNYERYVLYFHLQLVKCTHHVIKNWYNKVNSCSLVLNKVHIYLVVTV